MHHHGQSENICHMQALLDNATPVAVKFVTTQSFKEQEHFKREVTLKCLHHINAVHELDPW